MADVFTALGSKRTMLLKRRNQIEQDAKRQIAEIDEQLRDVARAVDVVNEAVKDILCNRCKGTGSVRQCDAAGQMEDVECPYCKGTGVRWWEDENGLEG